MAQWLIGDGIAPATYVASQGTVLGRMGRVHIRQSDGDIWVGGDVGTRIRGTLTAWGEVCGCANGDDGE